MTKSELVEQMAKNAGISKSAANTALNSFTESITKELKKKTERLRWSDSAHSQKSAERPAKGRNPQTGDAIKDQGHPMPLSSKTGKKD